MFYVYILSSRTGRLSAGVTRHIGRDLQEHRQSDAAGCAYEHQLDRLLLMEPFRREASATARQDELNRCTLTEKLELIRAANPHFDDLTRTLQQEAAQGHRAAAQGQADAAPPK